MNPNMNKAALVRLYSLVGCEMGYFAFGSREF
jgi:hypothetical protein